MKNPHRYRKRKKQKIHFQSSLLSSETLLIHPRIEVQQCKPHHKAFNPWYGELYPSFPFFLPIQYGAHNHFMSMTRVPFHYEDK
jgi:hypothetical protein